MKAEIEFSLPVGVRPTQEQLAAQARRRLGLPSKSNPFCVITRRSIDARGEIVCRWKAEVYDSPDEYQPYILPPLKDASSAPCAIVVGAGPAGLFAALKLLSCGVRPIVLERGRDVHARKADMALLSRKGIVNPDSNYCYGEGGAGAFSDGKLYTRSSKRGDNREVLYRLVEAGASPDILIDAHPHIGSDKLPSIVEKLRNEVLRHSGEYHFNSRVCAIEGSDGDFSVRCADGEVYRAPKIILATGHSARDVYEMLSAMGGSLEAKGFALGVRVEHPQDKINWIRYGDRRLPSLPAAEYSFVRQVDGRGVFSFCMCPGGILVPSSTEEGSVVLNGMSNSSRSGKLANAGVVVQIEPEDVPGQSPFRLMDFQRDVERRMYTAVREALANGAEHSPAASSNAMAAPAQRMEDFCVGRLTRRLPESSYYPGIVSVPLHELLPSIVADRLRKAFPSIPMKGYYTNSALLLGVESRTSSPVRIPRDEETLEYVSIPGIYPCGEGAGYSGGIVSSAVDGIRCAAMLADKLL